MTLKTDQKARLAEMISTLFMNHCHSCKCELEDRRAVNEVVGIEEDVEWCPGCEVIVHSNGSTSTAAPYDPDGDFSFYCE